MSLSEQHRRILAYAFVAIGVGLIPWSLFLAYALPSRHVETQFYAVAWAGFDVLLATVLTLTGVGLLRRSMWLQAVAASAATLLVSDAWFDVLTASRHGERLVALLMAIFAELPTAAVCIFIAWDAEAAAEQAHRYLRRGVRESKAVLAGDAVRVEADRPRVDRVDQEV